MPDLPQLHEILYSGQLAYGKYTRQFEKDIQQYIGRKENHVLATNSFNMAIAVVNSLIGINAGDEIVASPMACLASTQPFVSHGIQIKWADVDPSTGTLCPESVKQAITNRTKAIFHNHFCGYPGYVDEINDIGKKYGIPVIDDGIEGFGSLYKGKKMGNWGTDITVFAFGAVRVPNTIDGGCIVIQNQEWYERATLIRDCGINRNNFRDEYGEINPQCDIVLKGHSATMSNVNGYIGMCQMKDVDKILRAQQEQAQIWKEHLNNRDNIRILGRTESVPNYWVFGILAKHKKEELQKFRANGWYASGVHINNNLYSVFGKQDTLPGVKQFYSEFLALPCGWWIDKDNIKDEV